MEMIVAETVAERLARPLPGPEGWKVMQPPDRGERSSVPAEATAREGAVLVLLTTGGSVPLIQRTADGGPHSGQIAFPGGEREPQDRDIIATALREAQEEVTLDPTQCRVLGTLTPLYIPVSNFFITPVVALNRPGPLRLEANPDEVARIFSIALPSLMSTRQIVSVPEIPAAVPAFCLAGNVIWGATAMILSELWHVLTGENTVP